MGGPGPACYVCLHHDPTRAEPGDRVHVGAGWRTALAFDSALPGWLCLLPMRHVTGLHELTDDESLELGRLLRAASVALVEVTGCAKTYVMLFAEQEGFAHLHVHVVPRPVDLPADRRGPLVFGYLGSPDAQSDADRSVPATRLGAAIEGALEPPPR